jgi:hypothetical protein
VFFADGINNNIALGNPASARITSTNLPADNLANAGAQSCGLFQVSEGPGFVLGNLPHIPELPDLMPKPVLKGLDQSSRGLETSGMTVKFSTRRTQYNDLLTMLLRQMCADVPDLVLGFKRSNVGRFDDLTLNQSSLAGTLYEQMWGACNYLPVWTAADVQARQENLLAACDLDAVLNALGGRPLQMAGTINERVAFLLSHDLNWPPFPVLAP